MEISVEIEHYGGLRRTVPVISTNDHYKEVVVAWRGDVAPVRVLFVREYEKVTFSLKNGLIVAPLAQRNWRLTKESFDTMRQQLGLRPGHLHRWNVMPPRKPHVPRTREDPRQEKLF